jgi:hypothetical protein
MTRLTFFNHHKGNITKRLNAFENWEKTFADFVLVPVSQGW